jgi:hypothetical protein
MSCIGKSCQLFLDESREETRSNRQCSVVEIVMGVVDGAAADATGIANIDKGARAGCNAEGSDAPWDGRQFPAACNCQFSSRLPVTDEMHAMTPDELRE